MSEDQVKIKKESNMSDGMVCCSDGAHYPYGTSLRFEDDTLDELDVGALQVGDVVEVRGFAFVDHKSENESIDQPKNKSVSLQLTSIKLRRETDDVVGRMYGNEG